MTYHHLLSRNQNESFDNNSDVQSYNTSGQNMKLTHYRKDWVCKQVAKYTLEIGVSEKDIRCGYDFGIKSDSSLGLCMLPPSRQRDNPDFKYQNVEKEHKIGTDDRFYNKLTELFSKRYLLSEGGKEDHDNYNTSEDWRRIEYLNVLFRPSDGDLSKKQQQQQISKNYERVSIL